MGSRLKPKRRSRQAGLWQDLRLGKLLVYALLALVLLGWLFYVWLEPGS